MKKTFLLVGVMAGVATGVYAQGVLNWTDGQANYSIAVMSPNPGSPSVEQTGNTSWDLPAGSASYSGGWVGNNGAAPGGGVSATPSSLNGINYQNNASFSSGIYMASSTALLTSEVTSGTPLARSGIQSGTGSSVGDAGAYGTGSTLSVTDPNDAASAYVAIAAWDNAGGTLTSYAAAEAAGDPAGYVESSSAVPISATLPGNLQGGYGLTSFSLATAVPEPSTIALAVMGGSALLLRFRRK